MSAYRANRVRLFKRLDESPADWGRFAASFVSVLVISVSSDSEICGLTLRAFGG